MKSLASGPDERRKAEQDQAMMIEETSNMTSLVRVASVVSVLVSVLFALTLPVLAQGGTEPIPENAHERRFANGWECDLGYRLNDQSCDRVVAPENAHLTGQSYGTGWACDRGFELVDVSHCAAIFVPENAFLRSSGYGWQCERGYRRDGESCTAIALPEHAYLTDDYADSGWTCERGYVADMNSCVAIAVPENGYLTNARYGATWACERGFIPVDGRCEAIAVPANAFLDVNSYGPGWRCERGYEPKEDSCAKIELPAHAHLDLNGNSWSCNSGFRLKDGRCGIGQ